MIISFTLTSVSLPEYLKCKSHEEKTPYFIVVDILLNYYSGTITLESNRKGVKESFIPFWDSSSYFYTVSG